MAKVISFLSWNVENFHNDSTRVNNVVDQLAQMAPDVFGLYEVKGAAVFQAMVAKMPNYSFFVTESPGVPEILIGHKNTVSVFVTQRDELQSKVPTLRPGALATVTKGGNIYSLLFLHLKSFPGPRDWGLRDDMFQHVANLKRALDRVAPEGTKANFVALGDINTMGMSPAYNNDLDIDGAQELGYVDNRMNAKVNGMRRLPKTHHNTWWNKSPKPGPSSLDHVYASEHMIFKKFANDSEVEVTGWVNETTDAKKKAWIDKFSDHSILFGEIRDS